MDTAALTRDYYEGKLSPQEYTQRFALGLIVGGTRHVTDEQRNLAALAYGRAKGCYPLALRMVLAARKEVRDRYTLTQMDWQRKTSRRPARNHHADSWSLREKYVRCHQRGDEVPAAAGEHVTATTRRERERRAA